MPGFTPARRWQAAYRPFKNRPLPEKIFTWLERSIKGALFGCRMCGNCLLQETAFICPMECPKGLRNGPCGGSTPEHCYVDPTRPCIWYKIYERAEKMGRLDRLLEVLPPLDWDKTGTSAFIDLMEHLKRHGGAKAVLRWLRARPEERLRKWNRFFLEVRQPDWWNGDALPHPAPPHDPVSRLEAALNREGLVLTAEVSPPLTANPDDLIKKVLALKGLVEAVNFTDNPSATPRMSSLACSLIALQQGVEPVLQIAARDRNRMGLQAEVLGAAALGIRNILCLTGDHPRVGPQPNGRMDIWDLDSIQSLWILRQMRDEGRFLDRREIKCAPQIFLGAAGSPNSSTPLIQSIREEKKVNAGAQFLQTNLVFDLERFEEYLEALERREVTQRVGLLVGISPIRSVKAAHFMNSLPGVRVPDSYIQRMEASADPKEESIQMTLEMIEKIKNFPQVRGLHFMSVAWESIVPRLIKESGLRQ